MLLVFQMFFPTPVISQIESIGGGWAGGGWGEAGAGGKLKAGQTNHLYAKSSAVPSVCGTNCCKEAKTNKRRSLIPHAVLLMHPRAIKYTLVVSQHLEKAVYKSKPGYLLSSIWCFWIVH